MIKICVGYKLILKFCNLIHPFETKKFFLNGFILTLCWVSSISSVWKKHWPFNTPTVLCSMKGERCQQDRMLLGCLRRHWGCCSFAASSSSRLGVAQAFEWITSWLCWGLVAWLPVNSRQWIFLMVRGPKETPCRCWSRINQIEIPKKYKLVGAQPSPCCSFASHLGSGKWLSISHLLITIRTAQQIFASFAALTLPVVKFEYYTPWN